MRTGREKEKRGEDERISFAFGGFCLSFIPREGLDVSGARTRRA